jgi:hypothetical protein
MNLSSRLKVLKRVSSAQRKARAGLIFQVKTSQESFLGAKKG